MARTALLEHSRRRIVAEQRAHWAEGAAVVARAFSYLCYRRYDSRGYKPGSTIDLSVSPRVKAPCELTERLTAIVQVDSGRDDSTCEATPTAAEVFPLSAV